MQQSAVAKGSDPLSQVPLVHNIQKFQVSANVLLGKDSHHLSQLPACQLLNLTYTTHLDGGATSLHVQQAVVSKASEPLSQMLTFETTGLAMLDPSQLRHATDCDGTKLRLHASIDVYAGWSAQCCVWQCTVTCMADDAYPTRSHVAGVGI